jgi:Predicted periplasmic protein
MMRSILRGLAVSTFAAVAFLQMNGAALAYSGMELLGRTTPPIGYVKFCEKFAKDCRPFDRSDLVVKLTNRTMGQLNAINKAVNKSVEPATDMQIYGVVELWTYPGRRGDCEDYVLQKRKELITQGWPASALLITVVRDEVGDGHAILTVRTDRGDLVLDNKVDEILAWVDTPYHFVKRQSSRDPNAWDMISDNRNVAVGSINRR